MKAIKYILAVALLAICAYFALPKPERIAYYGVCIQAIIDEYHFDDFDEYCYREYLRRTIPDFDGWYSCGVCVEEYEKLKMELFYGRY